MISQPAHAWVSGQIARTWQLPPGDLLEGLFLAAEQHDLGFLEADRHPTLNPETGWPHSFLDMPAAPHLELWTRGIQQMLRFSRYSALLVSLHFAWLAKKNNHDPEDQILYDQFIADQEVLQTTLATSLQNDFYYAPHSTQEKLLKSQQLVSLWDRLSLLVCMGMREPCTIAFSAGPGDFRIGPAGQDGVFSLDPWPFTAPSLDLVCEGRHLLKPCARPEELAAAFKAAAPVTLLLQLRPSGSR